jgi:hypothetical protein
MAGSFSSVNGQPRTNLARLNVDGTLDSVFATAAGATTEFVYSVALQTDGKVLVGGTFTQLGGVPRNYVGRINADGTIDPDFIPNADNAVSAIAVQSDGSVLLGGSFSTIAGQTRWNIARLQSVGLSTEHLDYDGSTLTWMRDGPGPEVWRTSFEYSTNGVTWTNLAAGSRISGGWQIPDLSLPPGATIRARGYVTGGEYNGSSWFIESLLPTVAILTDDSSFGVMSNQFGFNLRSVGNPIVLVQGSTNLTQWTSLYTNTMSNGSLYFSDPDSTNAPQRFYRARLWP